MFREIVFFGLFKFLGSVVEQILQCSQRDRTDSSVNAKTSLRKTSVNYLCVPFAKHFEQPASIAQRVKGVLLIRRFDGIFKPGGYAWICKDLFEGHTLLIKNMQI